MNFFLKTVLISLSVMSIFSCEKDNSNIAEGATEVKNENVFSNREQANLEKLGFDLTTTIKSTITFPDNSTKEYYVDGDTKFPVNELSKLDAILPLTEIDASTELNEKLFSALNLAGGNRVYTIAFFDFNQQYQRQAIGQTIWAFNTILDTSVQLKAVFANGNQFGTLKRDISVSYVYDIGPAKAIADFPINNMPGKNIVVSYKPDIVATYNTVGKFRNLMMHEIGHTFGLVHSDYKAFPAEVTEAEGFGIKHIPGTDDSGLDLNSIMSGSLELGDRWYTNQDIVAMRYLYGYVPR
ncbi:M57 family metalloprotease [Aquimarina agarilytica]|uniref:M57 family metalloprotease n=1 Tax=Aquimarina agarilytica TaxID=1087449 RepID=UPI000288971C|nr:M57 family metalloprotease [Aquimarina agarilytica]